MKDFSNKQPWVLKKIVFPQHTDHAGVMWHGCYLNWLEEARVKALSEVGISYTELVRNNYEMPVVDLSIKYINSISHGEEVLLNSWLLTSKGIRMPWKTVFVRNNGETLAEAIVFLVLLKVNERSTRVVRRMPDYISKALLKLQAGPSNE